MSLASLSALKTSKYQIPAWKGNPNTSLQKKPLIIYHKAFQNLSASKIESHLQSVGVVEPQWCYTMYAQSHFHSTTHEVLSIASGSAKCCFGHEDNPGRIEPVLEQGDVVIVPAGVAHRLMEDYGGFQMVGSYPVGKNWDMCYGKSGEEDKIKGISSLAWFERDPVFGDQGPCLEV